MNIQRSMFYVKPGSVISFDSNPIIKYQVISCIKLTLFGGEGYQLNLNII